MVGKSKSSMKKHSIKQLEEEITRLSDFHAKHIEVLNKRLSELQSSLENETKRANQLLKKYDAQLLAHQQEKDENKPEFEKKVEYMKSQGVKAFKQNGAGGLEVEFFQPNPMAQVSKLMENNAKIEPDDGMSDQNMDDVGDDVLYHSA